MIAASTWFVSIVAVVTIACSASPAPADGGTDGGLPDAIASDASGDASGDATEGGLGTGLWVDPIKGSDGSPGTNLFPFKTIKKAFTVAQKGDVVNLVAGTYGSSNGDDFSTPIPDGVALVGTTPNGTYAVTLEAPNTSDTLTFAGSGAVSSVWLKGFGVSFTATTGTQALDTVAWSGGGPSVSGSAQMTINGVTGINSATIGTVSNTAKLVMNDATFGDVTGIPTCSDNATFSATNLTMASASNAFFFTGSCTASISKAKIGSSAGFLTGNGAPNVTLDSIDISSDTPAVNAAGGTITITNGTYSNTLSGSAITSSNATVTISGATIENSPKYGIEFDTGSVTATGITITNCSFGGIYTSAALKLRSSTIQNTPGRGVQGYGLAVLDLGTTTDHGNNKLLSNSVTDVDITLLNNQTVNASGNTWNASTQGADAAGHFAAGATSGFNATGANFITSSSAQLSLGP
ncbi:MAG TPA: DUF1565 domain-containing protein [Polyangiaceae bacterium]|jgi:hypothetical protein